MNNLLSVSTEVEHPNFVNPPKGEVKRGGSGPLLIDGAGSEALETRQQMRAAPPVLAEGTITPVSYARSTAPSGTIPVSRYRQNAINSLRARATMPIFRTRLDSFPNLF